MAFDDSFDELDRMLLSKSTDYKTMRATLQTIRQEREIARMLGPAQDNLYASIGRSHRKALTHLESGDIAAAMGEMAGPVAWFIRRFEGTAPAALAKAPILAEELRASAQLAERSEVLKADLKQSYNIHTP